MSSYSQGPRILIPCYLRWLPHCVAKGSLNVGMLYLITKLLLLINVGITAVTLCRHGEAQCKHTVNIML